MSDLLMSPSLLNKASTVTPQLSVAGTSYLKTYCKIFKTGTILTHLKNWKYKS